MQITEIKNDLATINYNPELNRLMISDFILIEDANQSILAQIISIEATMEDDLNSAMLKFLLSIDKEANLTQYTGYVPAKNATLILINPQEIVQLINGNEKNIFLGNLAAYPNIPVEIGIDFLRKRPYIQVDFVENKLQIIDAIISGLGKYNKKILLFDFSGLYSELSLPKVRLGDNFKLPLNYNAISYIAQEELVDCTNENRAIIQGILLEVQNYAKSIPDGFIPFDTFISVLDSQYEENNIPELLLLKNKLVMYRQQGIFAQSKSEFDFIDAFLKENKKIKFDLSELPSQWHKFAFISILDLLKTKCYLITDFTDDNSNKNIIKKLYEKTEVKPIVISSYNYKYQLQLKAMSKNMILFKPIQKVSDFAGYTSFLNILSQDTFIIWGEQTLFIPLILKISSIIKRVENLTQKEESFIKNDVADDNIINAKEDNFLGEELAPEVLNEVSENIPNEESNEYIAENQNNIGEIPLNKEDENIQQTPEISKVDENIELYKENINQINDTEDAIQYPDNEQTSEVSDDLPNENDLDFFFEEEVQKLTNDNAQNIEIVQDNSEQDTQVNAVENIEDIELDENLQEIEDKIIPQKNTADLEPLIAEEKIVQDNSVNSAGLPIVEETVTTDENESQKDTIDIPTTSIEIKSASVPVYNSEAAPQFDTKFAQGTYVHHPKYGRGIVEKIIKYGNKQLCLIIFDNEGRKLLDPNIADLKQI